MGPYLQPHLCSTADASAEDCPGLTFHSCTPTCFACLLLYPLAYTLQVPQHLVFSWTLWALLPKQFWICLCGNYRAWEPENRTLLSSWVMLGKPVGYHSCILLSPVCSPGRQQCYLLKAFIVFNFCNMFSVELASRNFPVLLWMLLLILIIIPSQKAHPLKVIMVQSFINCVTHFCQIGVLQ